MSETVGFLGDVHGDGKFLIDAFEWFRRRRVARVFQLGDLGYGYNPGTPESDEFIHTIALAAEMIPFWWVPGNHENYDLIETHGPIQGPEPYEIAPGFVHCPRGSRFTLGQITRAMACGGGVSIGKRIAQGHDYWWQETVSVTDIHACCEGGKVDVLLTHDAPSSSEVPGLHSGRKRANRPSEWNRAALQTILEATRPELLVHGHHHERYEFRGDIALVIGLACNEQPIEQAAWIGEFE
jgi:predicted phosphodiesterase